MKELRKILAGYFGKVFRKKNQDVLGKTSAEFCVKNKWAKRSENVFALSVLSSFVPTVSLNEACPLKFPNRDQHIARAKAGDNHCPFPMARAALHMSQCICLRTCSLKQQHQQCQGPTWRRAAVKTPKMVDVTNWAIWQCQMQPAQTSARGPQGTTPHKVLTPCLATSPIGTPRGIPTSPLLIKGRISRMKYYAFSRQACSRLVAAILFIDAPSCAASKSL